MTRSRLTPVLAPLAALALWAGAASAQTVAQQVEAQLRAQGFTHVEITEGPTQVKVEGIRGTQVVEYVYDLTTGTLLSREVGRVEAGDDRSPGVEYDRSDRDFVDVDEPGDDDDDGPDGDGEPGDDDGDHHGDGEPGDDDGDEDHDRGHGNDDDGFDDDNPGRGHGDDGVPGGGRGHDDDDDGDDDHGKGGDDRGRGHGRGHSDHD